VRVWHFEVFGEETAITMQWLSVSVPLHIPELFLLASVLGVSTESLYPPSFKKAKRRKSK
jgi:hypothetical protein